MRIVVIGSGGWGTALSMVLCDNGHQVTLWSHNPEKAAQLRLSRCNPLLPNVTLPEALEISGDLVCLREAEMVVFATPSFAVRATSQAAAPFLKEGSVVVSVSKGIEKGTNLRLSEILQQEIGKNCKVVALSGPSHAEEVSVRMPTGCVAAHPEEAVARQVQDVFMNDYFRVYTSPDIIGVELAAALKNVVALSCGVIAGMGYGDNTKALLMTRAMAEMGRLGERMGGARLTFAGLVIDWRVAVVVWGGFLILAILTKWVSLGSIWAGASFPFVSAFVYHDPIVTVLSVIIGALVVWKHRGNLKRILSGTESKFSFHGKKEGRP